MNFSFLAVLGALCAMLAQSAGEALQGFVLAGFVRVTLIHQTTWCVNSFGHMFGWRVEGATDRSTNSLVLALITLGDGFHSSHHTRPTAGVNAPAHWDASGWLLRALERLGLIWQLRR